MTPPRTRRLGTGIDALLSPRPAAAEASADGGLAQIPLAQLRPSPYQPRMHFDAAAIEELAASIRQQGVVQPIVVRRVGAQYELVVGERRLRAARQAGLDALPAVVRDLSDAEAAKITLIENIQREDLNPIEEAQALRHLAQQLGQTHEQVADQIGRARATVTNLLRLLELHPDVQQLVREGRLSMGHARVLVPLAAVAQQELARTVVKRGLSVRQTERLAKGAGPKKPPPQDPDLKRLQQRLSDHLGCPVTVRSGRRGGQLVVRYSSADSLQGLLARLGYTDD